MPVWFTALETHGPFPGPPPARNADSYLAEGDGTGGSAYGGGNSPRSVYGGSTFGGSKQGGHGRSPSKGSGILSVTGGAGGGGGGGGGTAGSTALHRRMDSNVSVKSGLGLRSGGAAAG